MPNASPSSGRDTSRASQRSSKTKDPPWSRRVLDAAHAVQAALQANNEILQASIEHRQFECQFAEFYSNWPRDEEYYTLLAECRQASPGATYSFLDTLTTTLIRCTMHAEEYTYKDEHKFKNCLSPSLSPRTNVRSSDLKRPLTAMKMSDTSLHPNIKSLRRAPVALPPVHGEVPSSVTKQMLEGEAVSKEKGTSTPEYSPIPLAALSLPKRMPIPSLRAAPSRLLEDESKRHLPMVTGQHKPINVVSPIPTPRINTRQATDPGTCLLTLNIAVHRPGVSLPFQSECRWSSANEPPVQAEALMSTKRPADKTVVSKRQTGTAMCSPLSPAIHSLPKPPPMQAVLPHPSNGEMKSPPSKMVSKTIQQPIKKAVISKR